jgi:hypothetical protein
VIKEPRLKIFGPKEHELREVGENDLAKNWMRLYSFTIPRGSYIN